MSEGNFKLRSFSDPNARLTMTDVVNAMKTYRSYLGNSKTLFYTTCCNYAPVGDVLTLSDVVRTLKHYRDISPAPQHLLASQTGYEST